MLPTLSPKLPKDWLTRSIAHRGLHDETKGVVENTPSAFAAAMERGYAIECDLQEAACGEPMVFHDASLERLTEGAGQVCAHPASSLRSIPFKSGDDRMQTLSELLEQVGGQTPLFIEVKGVAGQSPRFCLRIAQALAQYRGPVALMAFDPGIVAAFQHLAPGVPRGLVSYRYRLSDWPGLAPWEAFARTHLMSVPVAKPNFIAYNLQSLPAVGPWLARHACGLPIIVWTVRSEQEAEQAKDRAHAIVFEGFLP